MTEHSKKLRAKTANEYNKKMREQGKIRTILLRLDSNLADRLDNVLNELGESRPTGIKALLDFYDKHK